LTILFLPSQLLAEENWTSIKVSFLPDLAIPHQRNVQGLSIGLGNWTENIKGVQIGISIYNFKVLMEIMETEKHRIWKGYKLVFIILQKMLKDCK
jgi:hypothetical protein